MIWFYILQFFTAVLNNIFGFLPVVTALPTIDGVNLDTTVSNAIGYFNDLTQNGFWMIGDVWSGALILITYYSVKMLLRFLLGNRAPGTH